jgi:hypothetical protein
MDSSEKNRLVPLSGESVACSSIETPTMHNQDRNEWLPVKKTQQAKRIDIH